MPPADALPTVATAEVAAVVRGVGKTPPGTCEEKALGPGYATEVDLSER